MQVETLGDANSFSWGVRIRCLWNGREGLKHKRECGFRAELDMQTLVCTRGRGFPLARLADRLRCPRCGCRQVVVIFEPPATREVVAARGR
jgi:hypothetical protein